MAENMINRLNQLLNRFSLAHQLGDAKADFLQQINLSTFENIKKLVFILLIYHAVMFAVDYMNYQSGLWGLKPGYAYLFYSHVAIFLVLAAFVGILFINRYIMGHPVFPGYNWLTKTTILAVFIWCAAVSSIDQLIHDQITVFILGIFGAATFCLLTSYISLIIYGIASLVFFAGITWLQADADILQGHYINGVILVVLGWAVSRIIFYNKVKEFSNLRVIERQNTMLERMSIEDHLTGLHNRRYLQAVMEKCLAGAERFGQHLTFAIADIDRFKAVNDEFSHQTGDAVLKTIARIFKQNIRKTDDVSRYGGEEFIFILDRAGLSDAARLCEKIRKRVESYDWDRIAPGLRVTISFGLAEVNSHHTFDDIFRDADQKLYEAKKAGRNQVQY